MTLLRSLLVINSSSRVTRSLTRQLTERTVVSWQAKFPEGNIAYQDVGLNPLPAVDENWIEAAYAAPEARTPPMHSALAMSDRVIDQIVQTDAIVIGVPHYNFGMPATLKGYFEQAVRIGRTFDIRLGDAKQPYVGRLADRPILVISASGAPATETGGFNHHVNFVDGPLMATLNLIGLRSVTIAHVSNQQGPKEELAVTINRAEQTIETWVKSL